MYLLVFKELDSNKAIFEGRVCVQTKSYKIHDFMYSFGQQIAHHRV